jgi:hypothetical protein
MPRKNSERGPGKSTFADGFRVLNGPVVRDSEEGRNVCEFNNVRLPRAYGPPFLFAIARDSRTIFAYWNVDWASLFEKATPVHRQVHLRVYREDDLEEKSVAVEPMARVHYVTTSRSHGSYRVEIGYYQPADVWHSVARSNEVTMPPDGMAKIADVDFATIPFHVSFQQLVDLFGAKNDDALAAVISRFQNRALRSEGHRELSPEERKILRSTDVSLSEIAATRRAFIETNSEQLRKRTDALLGFDSTSPSRGFGEGSWSSGFA